ncbi:hypothetical protein HYV10_01765 [Candidatus Dependentiae bacterium]|nr:hypothetical protein [Candidatus Dependentiae bacterium]
MKVRISNLLYLNFILFIYSSASSANIDERFISPEELFQIKAEFENEGDMLETETPQEIRSINIQKSWTIMIYMAADNDLNYFAWKNLKQMELVGSNQNINIVVQLNVQGNNTTKRYMVKKGKRILFQEQTNLQEKLNSGSYHTLVNFVTWGTQNFPANNYALILWNHGTGAIDPYFGRAINPADLFYLNPTDDKFEIDRGISYVSLIYSEMYKHIKTDKKRGICFDDSFKSYISNHDLEIALSEIIHKVLHGKKLSLIGFDACLMSMIEVSSICKNYAEYFVGSQELEYGAGWKYDEVLEQFNHDNLDPKSFAKHIVISYERAYQKHINDYTLSAMELDKHHLLEQNVDNLANTLIEALKNQQNKRVSDTIRKCKSTQYCTCFDEPSYIDLADFYCNLFQHISHITLQNKELEKRVQSQLFTLISEGLNIIQSLIIENKVGPKLKRAQGISIYFPEHNIIASYSKSPFAINNQWLKLLNKYIHG